MTVFFVIMICLIAAVLLYVFVLVRPAGALKTADRSLFCNYAHRGLHGKTTGGLPENSLAAYSAAVKNGYGIELDVQLSKDGEVVVFHDYTLERMTGQSGKLSDKTAAELKELRLKTADGVFTDERIPTLREVLDLIDGEVPLLVELKGEDLDVSLPPKVDELLQGYSGPYCIESFNPILLGWYRKNRPDVLRGMLYTDVWREKGKDPLNFMLSAMMLNVIARPHFVAYNFRCRNNLPIRLTADIFGAARFAWTVRNEDELKQAEGAYVIFENVRP